MLRERLQTLEKKLGIQVPDSVRLTSWRSSWKGRQCQQSATQTRILLLSLSVLLCLSLAHAHTQWEQPARPPKRDAEAMNQGNENNFRLKASVGFCRSPLAASHVCAHRPCVNLLCARAFGYLGTCADSQSLAALGLVRLFRFIPPNVPKRR